MIMKLTYKPSGVCCKQIDVEVEDGILTNVEFTGGCQGNLAAIKLLVEGMKIEDYKMLLVVINRHLVQCNYVML